MSSEDESKPKNPSFVIVIIKMPDGKEHEIPVPSKIFKTGRTGFFAQIPAFAYDNNVYGGQIQIWMKTPKKSD